MITPGVARLKASKIKCSKMILTFLYILDLLFLSSFFFILYSIGFHFLETQGLNKSRTDSTASFGTVSSSEVIA